MTDLLAALTSDPQTPARRLPWWVWVVGGVLILLIASGTSAALIEMTWRSTFTPGTEIATIDVSGLNRDEALALVSHQTDALEDRGLTITDQQSTTTVTIRGTVDTLSSPDTAQHVYHFDTPATIDRAFDRTHGRNWLTRVARLSGALIVRPRYPLSVELDRDRLLDTVRTTFERQAARNAHPEISWQAGRPIVTITAESDGQTIDTERFTADFLRGLAYLSDDPITVRYLIDHPTITTAQGQALIPELEQLLSRSSLPLVFEDRVWRIPAAELAPMLEFTDTGDRVAITLDPAAWQAWADRVIAPAVTVEPQDARVELRDGKLVGISAHRDGRAIDFDATRAALTQNLPTGATTTVAIISQPAAVTTGDVNDLGISDIIGVGRSSFAGSPPNRRHNIKTGAAALHGILIPPGEEFSLITTLGEIDASNGYLPELVIKDNRTIPEYGGGLCQIGTTTFRATLASGLPVLERRNHSYSVTYYLENGLPGTDATIYDPKPDFRFLNDTPSHVLIQTRIIGDEVVFEFWGTKDGRVASRTTPRVWGWVSPPPTKIIETTDLAPGQKKCTESSHKGVNAAFDYTVTYPNGEVKTETFTSHYKPWQAVCLVGVAPGSGTSSSTPPTGETPPADTPSPTT